MSREQALQECAESFEDAGHKLRLLSTCADDLELRAQLAIALESEQYRGVTSFAPYCQSCGACCEAACYNPDLFSHLYASDDDRRCKHLTDEHRCEVYAERDVACQVDGMYELLFKHIPREQYYAQQHAMCVLLRHAQRKRATAGDRLTDDA